MVKYLIFPYRQKKSQFITVWWYFCSSLLRNSCMELLWCLQPMLSYWAVKMKFNILQPWAALWRCFWEHCAKTHMLSCPWICLVLLWDRHEPLAADPKWSISKNSSTLNQVSLHLRLKGTLAPSVALSQAGIKLTPIFSQGRTYRRCLLCQGDFGLCLAHIRDLHEDSNTFTWSHTKPFLHLSKRVVHVPPPL